MNTWIEMNNLPEREWALKIGGNRRLVIQEIEKEITRRSQFILIVIICGAATLASIILMMTAIFRNTTHPYVRYCPLSICSIQNFHY